MRCPPIKPKLSALQCDEDEEDYIDDDNDPVKDNLSVAWKSKQKRHQDGGRCAGCEIWAVIEGCRSCDVIELYIYIGE